MKGTIVAIFAFFALSFKLNAQDCNCKQNLDSLINSVEQNYVGYTDKVTSYNFKEYQAFKDSLISESLVQDSYSCFLLLKKYVQYFKDPHLAITIGMLKSIPVDTNAVRVIFKSFEQKNVTEEGIKQYLSKHRSDGIEGIWQNPTIKYKVAILKDTVKGKGYIGLALGSDELYWYNGQLKMEISSKGHEYLVKYYRNDHYPDSRNLRFEDGCMFISGYSTWTMTYPKLRLNHQPPKVCEFKKISNNTSLISITNLDISNKVVIDSVIGANMNTITKSKYLLIDLRNNSGGSILSCDILMPLLHTGPVVEDGFIVRSSKDNIATYKKNSKNPNFSATAQIAFKDIAEKMEKHGDGLVLISGVDSFSWSDTIKPYPQQIAILVNEGTVSAAELFALRGKQSKKVTIFGARTRGALDYTEGDTKTLLCPYFIYSCPIGMSDHSVTPLIDNVGIRPDVEIEEKVFNWPNYVMKYYAQHRIDKRTK